MFAVVWKNYCSRIFDVYEMSLIFNDCVYPFDAVMDYLSVVVV